jgi:hypothetical protein
MLVTFPHGEHVYVIAGLEKYKYLIVYLLRVAFPLYVSLLGMLFTKISLGIHVLWLVYVC